jgi:hypothetical protein
MNKGKGDNSKKKKIDTASIPRKIWRVVPLRKDPASAL